MLTVQEVYIRHQAQAKAWRHTNQHFCYQCCLWLDRLVSFQNSTCRVRHVQIRGWGLFHGSLFKTTKPINIVEQKKCNKYEKYTIQSTSATCIYIYISFHAFVCICFECKPRKPSHRPHAAHWRPWLNPCDLYIWRLSGFFPQFSSSVWAPKRGHHAWIRTATPKNHLFCHPKSKYTFWSGEIRICKTSRPYSCRQICENTLHTPLKLNMDTPKTNKHISEEHPFFNMYSGCNLWRLTWNPRMKVWKIL